MGHGRPEATSDRLIASAERPVTIIPLTIGLSVTGKKPVSAVLFLHIFIDMCSYVSDFVYFSSSLQVWLGPSLSERTLEQSCSQ